MKDFLKKIRASKKTHWFLFILALFLLVDEVVFTSGTMRYRMTVRIDTPEGIKEGSAVREIFMSQGIKLTPESHAVTRFKGESVVVDLGKRGQVFTVINDAQDRQAIFDSFPRPDHPKGGGELTREGIRYYRKLTNGTKILPPELYPFMVRFKDLKDPESVESLLELEMRDIEVVGKGYKVSKPVISADHFEENFGKGVKIKDITLEMLNEITDDWVTYSIEEKWLPWIGEYKNKYFDGERYGSIEAKNKLANSLGKGSFTTGD